MTIYGEYCIIKVTNLRGKIMYKLCKTEQSAKRQREIENCLFEIMKGKHYEEITITEICEKMNMPRKAFYRYFDSKDDAMSALIDHSMAEYSGFVVDKRNDAHRSLILELEEYFIFWYDRRDLLDALDKSGLVGHLIERTVNFPISDRIAVARFLPNDNARTREMIFRFAFSGLVYVMISWYRDGFKTSTREMAETTCRLLKDPLFPQLKELGIE